MNRHARPRAALATLTLVILGVAGCGSGGPSGTGARTASSTHEQGVTFARCMRDNGVSGFPDPDASGSFTIDGVLNGSSLDPGTATWKHAIAACKDLEPAGFTGHKASPEEMKARLRFAQCIRDNGVKDFPDPVNGEPLVDTTRIPSANRPGGMTILNAAMRRCGSLVDVSAGGPR